MEAIESLKRSVNIEKEKKVSWICVGVAMTTESLSVKMNNGLYGLIRYKI